MSKIEVNAVEPQCGTTLTLGANNDFIKLGTGAGFSGGIGTVRWETTPQTGSFGATAGRGYFMNTTSGALTLTLPSSPSAGDIVGVRDYANTAATNNITIARNSSNIDGAAADLVLNTTGSAVTLVYVDGTRGWVSVNSNEITGGVKFITATGGTETTCGDYKIHTFTGPGCFTVSCAGNPAGSSTVDYLVIAGGAGGASADHGGGGGAGGYRFSNGTASGCYSAGPAPLGASALPVSSQSYPITVGGGGAGGAYGGPGACGNRGTPGNNSIFSSITSTGGGGGGQQGPGINPGLPGGSGGGGTSGSGGTAPGGTGNTPPVSPPQGFDGGSGLASSPAYGAGGGGGASQVGVNGSSSAGGAGGDGLASSITASSVTRGGGGGGAALRTPAGAGGAGGGGAGSIAQGGDGTANTGGGGGGSERNYPNAQPYNGGSGGSGIVIIRYKFQ